RAARLGGPGRLRGRQIRRQVNSPLEALGRDGGELPMCVMANSPCCPMTRLTWGVDRDRAAESAVYRVLNAPLEGARSDRRMAAGPCSAADQGRTRDRGIAGTRRRHNRSNTRTSIDDGRGG